MNKRKKAIKFFAVGIAAVIICELFVFNFAFFASRINRDTTKNRDFEYSSLAKKTDEGFFVSDFSSDANVVIDGINKEVKYIYINADFLENSSYESLNAKEREAVLSSPLDKYYVDIRCKDEGNENWYLLGEYKIYKDSEKSKYIRLHTYGKVKALKITFKKDSDDGSGDSSDKSTAADKAPSSYLLKVNSFNYNVKVPLCISPYRIIIALLTLTLIYLVYSGAHEGKRILLSELDFKNSKQRKIINYSLMLVVLIAAVLPLLTNGTVRPWYNQYFYLAKSLTQGRFDIDIPLSTVLQQDLGKLPNPYDTNARKQVFDIYNCTWDTAYYNGRFYCYFGIVPCIVFYLPYYLIFKQAFPTEFGIAICLAVYVILSFTLIKYTAKKYFKNISLGAFILSFLLFIASSALFYSEFEPTFYSLPTLMALDFTVGGILLWLKSADCFKKNENDSAAAGLIFGSLCMALVAGCRPQFLLVSFFCIPIFKSLLFGKNSKDNTTKKILNLILFALPYIIIGGGLMYYNYARFDSVFDFGSNYNLTTNDMTHRGFYFGRIGQGLFDQLFRLANLSYHYPFVKKLDFDTYYIGRTIHERSYGGLFAVCPALLSVFALPLSRKKLKEKKLYAAVIMMLVFALVIAVANIEMAGELIRYWTDYAFLLAFASVLIILQLFESFSGSKNGRKLLFSLLPVLLIFTVLVNLFGMLNFEYADSYSLYEIFTLI